MFDLADVLKGVPNLGTSKKQLEYIKRELIDPDPNNFYSLTGIEELAANIQLCGLQQPILVRPSMADGTWWFPVTGVGQRSSCWQRMNRKSGRKSPVWWSGTKRPRSFSSCA